MIMLRIEIPEQKDIFDENTQDVFTRNEKNGIKS